MTVYSEPIHGSVNYGDSGPQAIVTESTFYEAVDRAYPDGVPTYELANTAEGFDIWPDSLAHFVIVECTETADLGGGAFEPAQAAYAMRRAADELLYVAQKLETLATQTAGLELHERTMANALRALDALRAAP